MKGLCKQLQDQMTDHVLGLLNRQQQETLWHHVKTCTECDKVMRETENKHNLLSDLGQQCETEMPVRIDRCIDALNQVESGPRAKQIKQWRKIMTMPIFKLAAAAIVAVTISITTVFQPGVKTPALPSLLAMACAAEDTLFAGTLPVHIRNEITVHPCDAFRETGQSWLPMCSLKANGSFRFDQLVLPIADEPYTVVDQAWYDPPSGRFIRLLETENQVIFANSYDGEFVYTSHAEPGGKQAIAKKLIASGFQPPARPADFFGLAAGLRSGLSKDSYGVVSTEADSLDDGTPVKVFKVGTEDPAGNLESYWLFKVRQDNHTIAEKVFVVNGQIHIVIRRILSDTLDSPDINWDMKDVEARLLDQDQAPGIAVKADMVVSDVSVRHMIERSSFATYVFSQQPPWTEACTITDVADPASPGERMFIFTCRASDSRHVVLVQSATYNKMLGQVVKQGDLVYESPNGFGVIGGGRSKWMAKILLGSASYFIKDKPSEECVGFILTSPDGTYPALAINGPLTDQELHTLIDSLMPAKAYVKAIESDQ
jgi:hypothetical protein